MQIYEPKSENTFEARTQRECSFLSNVPPLPVLKKHSFFGSILGFACLSFWSQYYRNGDEGEHRWNDTEGWKLKYSEKKLVSGQFVPPKV